MSNQKLIVNGEEFDIEHITENTITTRRIKRRPWWKRWWSGIKSLWGSK